MTAKSKTSESAVLDAAANVVNMTLIRPSDLKGSEANVAVTLDREIRAGFSVVLESQSRLVALVKEAKDSQIHKRLNDPETGKAYKSWTAYIGNVIAGLDVDVKRLGARDKAFLVVMLYNTGMSQKVIASALSMGVGTVNRAIQAGRTDGSVDAERETESKDGRTFKETEKDAAKGNESKTTKTPAQKADAHVKALTNLLDQMSADELLYAAGRCWPRALVMMTGSGSEPERFPVDARSVRTVRSVTPAVSAICFCVRPADRIRWTSSGRSLRGTITTSTTRS